MVERDEGYVLFGRVCTEGRTRSVVAAFGCESEARGAFLDLRLRAKEDQDWAELVAVGEAAGLRRLCWFGPAAAHAVPAVPTQRAASRTRLLWRLRPSHQRSGRPMGRPARSPGNWQYGSKG